MQLPLHEFSISSIAFIKLHSKDSHATVVIKCLAKITTLLLHCSRSRSITAVHLALKGHINAVWRSQRHALLLLTGETLSASQKT